MFKKTVMASLFATALAGCSSIPSMESAVGKCFIGTFFQQVETLVKDGQ